MIKTKVAFLQGWLLSSQSEQLKKYSKTSGWLEKAGPQKSHFCFDHVNRLYMCRRIQDVQVVQTKQKVIVGGENKISIFWFISIIIYRQ